MTRSVFFILVALLVVASAASPAEAANPRVAILCAPQATYKRAAQALQEQLIETGHDCTFIELPGAGKSLEHLSAQLVDAQPDIVAAAGARATAFARNALPDVPVVFFMVPNVLDAAFITDGKPLAGLAGVAADVSPEDQIAWLSRIHKPGDRIAVLHSARTTHTLEALDAAARRRGLQILPVAAARDRFPDAIDALSHSECDGVLMLPDANVFNSSTVQRLLLWGVRNRKPVWSFSGNIVKAGAVGGQSADYAAVGRQAAELAQQCAAGTPPEELGLQYPNIVNHAVNERTARMIGITVEPIATAPNLSRWGTEP